MARYRRCPGRDRPIPTTACCSSAVVCRARGQGGPQEVVEARDEPPPVATRRAVLALAGHVVRPARISRALRTRATAGPRDPPMAGPRVCVDGKQQPFLRARHTVPREASVAERTVHSRLAPRSAPGKPQSRSVDPLWDTVVGPPANCPIHGHLVGRAQPQSPSESSCLRGARERDTRASDAPGTRRPTYTLPKPRLGRDVPASSPRPTARANARSAGGSRRRRSTSSATRHRATP